MKEDNTTSTNFLIKPSEAQKYLRVGEKIYMSNPLGGEDIKTVVGFTDGMIFIRGDITVIGIPMTEDIDNLPDQKILYEDRETGIKKFLIIKAPHFRKAPELNQ